MTETNDLTTEIVEFEYETPNETDDETANVAPLALAALAGAGAMALVCFVRRNRSKVSDKIADVRSMREARKAEKTEAVPEKDES